MGFSDRFICSLARMFFREFGCLLCFCAVVMTLFSLQWTLLLGGGLSLIFILGSLFVFARTCWAYLTADEAATTSTILAPNGETVLSIIKAFVRLFAPECRILVGVFLLYGFALSLQGQLALGLLFIVMAILIYRRLRWARKTETTE